MSTSEQQLLNSISKSLISEYSDMEYNAKRRIIKDLFLKRDFEAIFTNKDLLPTYSAEYIGGRSLCYSDVFSKLELLRNAILKGQTLCLGAGNGAELCAIASIVPENRTVSVQIQDWSDYNVLERFKTRLEQDYKITLNMQNQIGNLLENDGLESCLNSVSKADVVTACFVLNEVMTASKKAFVFLMTGLVKRMKQGAFLLVIEPAGSFSDCSIGSNESGYQIFHLLDAIQAFECVEKVDSKWYRFPQSCTFPIKLNNMRYSLRLFKKV
jgi:25S rRNA (uracil2843-N3)-methyltransferase